MHFLYILEHLQKLNFVCKRLSNFNSVIFCDEMMFIHCSSHFFVCIPTHSCRCIHSIILTTQNRIFFKALGKFFEVEISSTYLLYQSHFQAFHSSTSEKKLINICCQHLKQREETSGASQQLHRDIIRTLPRREISAPFLLFSIKALKTFSCLV